MFSFDLLPRISRAQSMDALSSQATVSGYRAGLTAAEHLSKFFPMFMTAAGTVPPAKVLEKVADEAGEIVDAQKAGAPPEKLEDEIGDLLFVVVNLARHLKVDPEKALRATNAKFVRRFRSIESALKARGKTPTEVSLDEMEALWQDAKKAEPR